MTEFFTIKQIDNSRLVRLVAPNHMRECARVVSLGGMIALCAFLLIIRLNRMTILLSFPALAISIAYPFFKRFFALPQAFLGVAFATAFTSASWFTWRPHPICWSGCCTSRRAPTA